MLQKQGTLKSAYIHERVYSIPNLDPDAHRGHLFGSVSQSFEQHVTGFEQDFVLSLLDVHC